MVKSSIGRCSSMVFGHKVLFLAPHSDDEVWCAGTIARFVEEGKEVHYAVFSFCEESVPPGYPPDVLHRETAESLEVLGISEHTHKYNFQVRCFPERARDIRETAVSLLREISPHVVMVPSTYDWHQDHQVITSEARRVFRFCSILGYETALKLIPSEHSCFIKIEERHLQKKLEAAACYKSQDFRKAWEDITSLARMRGRQVQVEFAEMFEVIRLKV